MKELNRRRVIIVNVMIAFGFVVVFFRLFDLMILKNRFFSEKAKSQQIKAEEIQVRRGNIFDRRGRPFAVNVEVESLYCDPHEAVLDKERMRRLASILAMDQKTVQEKMGKTGRFTWIERKMPCEKADEIRAMNIKGMGFFQEGKRFYPKRDLAAHVVGTVGRENQALEGIELKYDRHLTTRGGKVYFSRDATGRELSTGIEMEARGSDVYLTIDEGLQYIVERELDHAMQQWRPVGASAIMMDPFTGEILALANKPAYDLNEISGSNRNEVRNRAITDIYEPGSTFKIIGGTAAIEEGLFRLDSRFDCSRGSIEIGGKAIRDAHRHGVLTFQEVIKKSSNVGSILIALQLGKERLYEYARRFGIGEKTGIDLPGEVSGWIRKPEKWSATSIGAIPIGQEVAVTPLQILRAYAAIANGGYLVRPHVVAAIRSSDGQPVFTASQEEKQRAISEKTAAIFRDVLKTVVEDGGTATGAAVDGNQVAGKTGTAQLIDQRTKRYSKDRFISSFVGFVPADSPRFALIVVVYEPKGQNYGGIVAGPVFKRIADQALSYMNVPRDDEPERNLLLVSR